MDDLVNMSEEWQEIGNHLANMMGANKDIWLGETCNTFARNLLYEAIMAHHGKGGSLTFNKRYIPLKKVSKYNSSCILINSFKIPVGNSYGNNLKKYLEENKLE